MVRTPYIDENGLKKGAWSVEEDDKLRSYVQRYGHWNWREIPKFAGLARCGKSCRLRWLNYLRPNVKLGSFTKDEEDLIIKLHLQLGNRWSKIAANLPGRTDNEIKNYWHTHLKKRVRQQPSTLTSKPRKRIGKKIQIKDNYDLKDNNVLILESYPYPLSPLQPQQSNHINKSENSSSIPSSSSSSSSSLSSSSSDHDHDQENNTLCSWDFNDELLDGSFWDQPFFTEDCYEQDDCYDNNNNNNVDFDFDFSLFDQSLCSPFWDSLDFSCSVDL